VTAVGNSSSIHWNTQNSGAALPPRTAPRFASSLLDHVACTTAMSHYLSFSGLVLPITLLTQVACADNVARSISAL